ncbi:ankyrin repeat domain-containing protein 23-like isoform X2 [Scylla paramamosain]|uniref:ankyrin repeat domain-containing protein 23-like isoform X2 n=1 Tax=Scylla paramamosain TaxID=85552 RepID=UPI0030836D8F
MFDQDSRVIQSAFLHAIQHYSQNTAGRRLQLHAFVGIISMADAFKISRLNIERMERVEPILKFYVGPTLLHWAASKGYHDLVVDLLVRGLSVDACDRLGRTPLGLATFAGHSSTVSTLLQENAALSAEDKDWRIISREEVGLCLVRVIEETAVCSFDAARSECFTLLYLAAQQGYPNMMHRLLSLKVSPDVRNNQGETPLFVTSLAMPSSPLHITRHWGQVRSGLPRPAGTI